MNIIKREKINTISYELPSLSSPQLILIILFSLIYSIILVNIPLMAFQDRQNYLETAQYAHLIFRSYLDSQGIISLFTNEPIWLQINMVLHNFLEPEAIVKAIIFWGAFLSSFSFLRLSPRNFILLVIILLIPTVLKNYITHLRQGLAIGFFMFGLLFSGWYRVLFLGLTPFIHASFFFVLLFAPINKIIDKLKNFTVKVKLLIFSFLSVLICLNVKLIAIFFQDRRISVYEFQGTAEKSGLGWLFWFFILILMLLSGEKWLKQNLFSLYSLVFYLCSYFLVEFTGRIFESSILLVFISCLNLTNYRKIVFIMALCFYGTILWLQILNSDSIF